MRRKHLIIGCGSAALSALEKIRSVTKDDEIKIVSAENENPYSPTALPGLLSRRIGESDLCLRDQSYFDAMQATFVKGKPAAKVMPREKMVVYRDGERDSYDTLLIATGADPVKPSIRGMDDRMFIGFHSLADCRKLDNMLKEAAAVTILGGGLVATELAVSLAERGCRVSLIVRSRLLRSYFSAEVGSIIGNMLCDEGIQIITGVHIHEVKQQDRKKVNLTLSSGDQLDSDVLIICTGVMPRVSLLKGSGVRVNTGVIVDSNMRTSAEAVYAAGDVAEAPDFFEGRMGINAILPSAVDQGKIAGANMAGEKVEYAGWISMNTFNFFGNKACSIGRTATDGSEVLAERSDEERRFKQLNFIGERVVGAAFLNVEVDPGMFLHLIKSKTGIGAHKEQLFQQPREMSRWLARKNN